MIFAIQIFLTVWCVFTELYTLVKLVTNDYEHSSGVAGGITGFVLRTIIIVLILAFIWGWWGF